MTDQNQLLRDALHALQHPDELDDDNRSVVDVAIAKITKVLAQTAEGGEAAAWRIARDCMARMDTMPYEAISAISWPTSVSFTQEKLGYARHVERAVRGQLLVRIAQSLYTTPPASQEQCKTCNGHGLVGGFMQDGSGYGEGCPDCNPEPNASQEQAVSIELAGVQDAIKEKKGFWRSCSGCHELNEGHDTGPYSKVFCCTLGNGCSECGGLGAVWDNTDYEDMARHMMAASHSQAQQPSGEVVATDDMRSAVRWAPSSAYWSEKLVEFFGPDARKGINALERQLREALATPKPEPIVDEALWEMWVDSPSDVLAFARRIEAHHGITAQGAQEGV